MQVESHLQDSGCPKSADESWRAEAPELRRRGSLVSALTPQPLQSALPASCRPSDVTLAHLSSLSCLLFLSLPVKCWPWECGGGRLRLSPGSGAHACHPCPGATRRPGKQGTASGSLMPSTSSLYTEEHGKRDVSKEGDGDGLGDSHNSSGLHSARSSAHLSRGSRLRAKDQV